jgi:hypothetical protein
LIHTIAVELARTAHGKEILALGSLVRAKLASLATVGQVVVALRVAERIFVTSAAFEVADIGRVAERIRVAVGVELVGADLETGLARRAGLVVSLVASEGGGDSEEGEKERGEKGVHRGRRWARCKRTTPRTVMARKRKDAQDKGSAASKQQESITPNKELAALIRGNSAN